MTKQQNTKSKLSEQSKVSKLSVQPKITETNRYINFWNAIDNSSIKKYDNIEFFEYNPYN
jgi:hypothetical protein